MEILTTSACRDIITRAANIAKLNQNKIIMAEHIEMAFLYDFKNIFETALGEQGYNDRINSLQKAIDDFTKFENIPTNEMRPSPFIIDSMAALHATGRAKIISLKELFAIVCSINVTHGEMDYHPSKYPELWDALMELDPAGSPIPASPGFEKENVNWRDYVRDLRETADEKPLIGRKAEMDDVIRVLLRHDKSNPCLVGEPGVGKTAIAEGLAKKINADDVPEQLRDATIMSVDLAGMLAGSEYRGQFEERLKAVLEGSIAECKTPILFFDEIHMLIGAGASSGKSFDAANILKPYLTQGKIKFIGATTFDEYRQNIEKDAALARRFKQVVVNEPTIKDCIGIINGILPVYEKHHNVSYTQDAVEAAVKLSVKYMNDRFLPDKAIDIIDEAGAANTMKDRKAKKIRVSDIEAVIQKTCHIPKITNEADDFASVKNLDKDLGKKVFGQEDAIKVVSDAIKLSKSGLGNTEKPIASFLFVGPSGVGKTELTKQIAADLKIPLIRFDMSEYQEQHSVAKLTGAPAGYVGYEDGGILTEAVRKTPHCVVLFDEIEKAHPDVFKVFLQVMDYGMLTDNKGRKADFRNTVIIMTSNAGATVVNKVATLGFTSSDTKTINVDGIMEAVNNTFAPEFRNRLTKIVVFNGLNNETSRLVVKKELAELAASLKKKDIKVDFTDDVVNRLVKLGISDTYGARGIQRTIDEYIRKIFVDAIINGDNLKNCLVDLDADGDFKIKTK